MATSPRYMELRLSGGAANTTPDNALGGAMSTAAGGLLAYQSFSGLSLAGITITGGSGNNTGTGTLTFTLSGTLLQWTPPGGIIGPAVNVGTDGTYLLYDSTLTRYIVVAKSGSLPGANASSACTVSNVMNAVFDDLTVANAINGQTDYRCVYVKNAHGTETMAAVRLWLEQDPNGPSLLQFGLDPAGVNGTATTIADVFTAPAGVSFGAPAKTAPLYIGNLTAGQYIALWIKRVIPAGSAGGTVDSLAKIGALWS